MNTVYSINGPVIKIRDTKDFSMQEMVYVGSRKLVGEVIGITDTETVVQVYESTTGMTPGEPVVGSHAPLSVTLGPGILSNIFDGIERPLKMLAAQSGAFISEGISVSALDDEKLWDVTLK
ncbi:MAG: V-type ATP synthase subunit A, partial [Oscillospiraceae bacterium]|nr:V-type ATP synthase subunit A [Oscillospiraceae bacterium]